MALSVVVPVYNENNTIEEIVRRVDAVGDPTGRVLEQNGARFVVDGEGILPYLLFAGSNRVGAW